MNRILMNGLFVFALVLGLGAPGAFAQESALAPMPEEQQKEKAEKEKKALALLEQVVDEAQLFRLPENRVRVQTGAAELLWSTNEGRARSLFTQAADNVAEMFRSANAETAIGERRNFNQTRTPGQLRQELILTAARYDAPLAYQLLAATRPPTSLSELSGGGFNSEDNLEQRLLAQVAALDPKLALQNAEQLLEKGKYPQSLIEVLTQLRAKDKEAAAKLEDKLLKRLTPATILSTGDAGSLALGLLRPGPRVSTATTTTVAAVRNQPFLPQSSYVDLLGAVIDSALKATPQAGNATATNQQRQGRGRGRGASNSNQTTTNSTPTPAETEQANARRLLSGLQTMLPQIDQHLPSRAQAVRQKIADLGVNNDQRATMNQLMNSLGQNTSEGMLAVAATAPAGMQSRIYRSAALRALDEGNVDRARQIANDHLEGSSRDSILRTMELQQVAKKAQTEAIEDVRRMLAGLANDEQRVDLLLEMVTTSRTDNPKLTSQLLEEARQLTSKRATNYDQFDQQLRVADAFSEVAVDRSFEIIEPGIMQLNELLSAAATLSGFEVSVFRDGEMPLQSGNGLTAMVARFGQRLGTLSTKDYERALTLANRFQASEARVVAKLMIVRNLLGIEPAVNFSTRPFQRGNFRRRE